MGKFKLEKNLTPSMALLSNILKMYLPTIGLLSLRLDSSDLRESLDSMLRLPLMIGGIAVFRMYIDTVTRNKKIKSAASQQCNSKTTPNSDE